MRLQGYLDRLHYHAPVRPDLATLTALHRAHLMHIPYENLDIHRGCPITLDPDAIYAKLVTAKRGGWCFEMNSLFGWALREIGFPVTLLASSVGRASAAEPFTGTHLVLRVDLDRPYLADVGFGNGLFEPIPLAEGQVQQGIFTYNLRADEESWWFTNQAYGGPGFDFTLDPWELSAFAPQSQYLQTSPDSGFVKTTVCFRWTPDGYTVLRGAVLGHVSAAGKQETIISDRDTYARTLTEVFDLQFEDIDPLWEKVWERHQARQA